MNKLYDVIIVGAGPVGLFLACELGLSRASVLVLERDLEPGSPWKAEPLGYRGLNTQSVETFYRRGLLSKFFNSDKQTSSLQKTPSFKFGGHFAGIMLDANKLDLDRWKYRLPGPALFPGPTTIEHIETALTERAESLGVTILRGNGVKSIAAQDDDGVTVEAGENQSFRCKWLVGCDGGRSVIRKAAGFDFVGTEPKFTGYAVKCDLDNPEKLKPGFHDITQEHIQSVLSRVTGTTDVTITAIHLATSFTDRARQTTSYRKGRVLLAGDAAHIHPPLGAQGLNVGLGDAVNLGWKLAATVRQESSFPRAPLGLALLDTYESERHPVAARVLEWTLAQVVTMQSDPYSMAVRAVIRDLIDTTDGTNLFIDRVWGLSQRYNLGDGEAHSHPLVGCSAPDFELHDGSRLGPKLDTGKGLLVDFENDMTLKELVVGRKYEARVDYIGIGAKDMRGLRALLIRPDGVVAWVAEENVKPDIDAAKAALERWFGF